jgi:predicted  nucleic acid-binding Zn-ribbon protein
MVPVDEQPATGGEPTQKIFSSSLPSRRRDRLDEEEHPGEPHWLLGTIVAVVLALLIAGGVYSYRTVGPNFAKLSLLPAMQDQIGAAGRRIDAAEEALRSWSSQQDAWNKRLGAMESRIGGILRASRKQNGELVARAQQGLRAELDRRTESLQTSLDQVQTAQQSADAQLSRVEERLNQMQVANNREVEQLREELRQARSASTAAMADIDGRIARVDQRSSQSASDLESIHRKVDQERTDFEVGINHDRELAQGVSMDVSHTDALHQRFDGWIWLMPDRKTIWLHNRGIQQPVTFYTEGDARPRELVVTRVTKYSLIGYILMPRQNVVATSRARDLAVPVPPATN